MDEKDILVRLSGDATKVSEAFSEIIEKAAEIGLIGEDLNIKNLPSKIEKKNLQNKSSSDILIQVSTSENKAEYFMEDIISIASEILGLEIPSTSIELLNGKSNEKTK